MSKKKDPVLERRLKAIDLMDELQVRGCLGKLYDRGIGNVPSVGYLKCQNMLKDLTVTMAAFLNVLDEATSPEPIPMVSFSGMDVDIHDLIGEETIA